MKLTLQQIQEKVRALKASGSFDLSTDEDLSLAIMNLVSLEEHFFFTAEKTKKDQYFDLLAQTREMRKTLLAKMIPRHEGETWCVSKHLLAATMRLMEVGTKLQTSGDKEGSIEMFNRAYELYSLFWALRLKLIDLSNLKKIDDTKLNIHDKAAHRAWTKEDIVSKLVDCCNE